MLYDIHPSLVSPVVNYAKLSIRIYDPKYIRISLLVKDARYCVVCST